MSHGGRDGINEITQGITYAAHPVTGTYAYVIPLVGQMCLRLGSCRVPIKSSDSAGQALMVLKTARSWTIVCRAGNLRHLDFKVPGRASNSCCSGKCHACNHGDIIVSLFLSTEVLKSSILMVAVADASSPSSQ